VIDIPAMPDDWWPDIVVIRGEMFTGDRHLTVSFAIDGEAARHRQILDESLKETRVALWQELHGVMEPM
jgi:hypothetical protein